MSSSATPKAAKVRLFRLRQGQVALLLLLVLAIVGLGASSYFSIRVQQEERSTLTSAETTASTVSIAQRESFSLALSVALWGQELATTREVQIDRALLGQRLNVATSTGERTFELTPVEYQEALAEFDVMLAELATVRRADRAAFLAAQLPVLENFKAQSRELTPSFAELTRAELDRTSATNLRFQIAQSALLALIVILFLTLAIWIASDIRRRYLEAAQRLDGQRQLIDIARQRLDLRKGLDERSESLLHRVREGMETRRVIEAVQVELSGILPGMAVSVTPGADTATAEASFDIEVTSVGGVPITTEDIETITARVREVITVTRLRDEAALEVSYQREHDPITGLPNQVLFVDELAAQFVRATRGRQVCAITILTIDRFREIQNSVGHSRADALVITVAGQLRDLSRSSEFVARLTGEEFAVVSNFRDLEAASARARELAEGLHQTSTLGDVEVKVSVSAGVATSVDGETAQEIMNHGAIALYLARQTERSGFVVFRADEHLRLSTLLYEELAVQNALRLGEFRVFYQPIVSLQNGTPVGFEALTRWQRPDVGLVAPGQFLGTIKRAGLTNDFGEWVMDDAIRGWSFTLLPHLRAQGVEQPYLTINVDAPQVESPNFTDLVLSTIARHRVPADTICLEITEHELAAGPGIPEKFASLRNAGLRIALDDFGTGYSSLGQLRDLPIDIVKIDRSFLPTTGVDSVVGGLVADIYNMADNLGLAVVAEGVETGEVARQLQVMGIGFAQGNIFGLPVPEPEADAWLESHAWISVGEI